MRIMMVVTSAGSYWLNEAAAKARYENAATMNSEKPLTSLVWLTSLVSIAMTYLYPTSSSRAWATGRSGGSSPRSSAAGRSRARSSPSW